MSQAEILEELPKLNPEERQTILDRLCDLQGRDLLSARGPTEALKKLLDEELDDYERTGDSGTSWDEFVSEFQVGAPE